MGDLNFVDDTRYLNICVEHTNYNPISFDEILDKLGLDKHERQRKND